MVVCVLTSDFCSSWLTSANSFAQGIEKLFSARTGSSTTVHWVYRRPEREGGWGAGNVRDESIVNRLCDCVVVFMGDIFLNDGVVGRLNPIDLVNVDGQNLFSIDIVQEQRFQV